MRIQKIIEKHVDGLHGKVIAYIAALLTIAGFVYARIPSLPYYIRFDSNDLASQNASKIYASGFSSFVVSVVFCIILYGFLSFSLYMFMQSRLRLKKHSWLTDAMVLGPFFIAVLCLGIYSGIIYSSYVRTIEFNRSIIILSESADEQILRNLESRFVQMKTRQDHDLIMQDIDKLRH